MKHCNSFSVYAVIFAALVFAVQPFLTADVSAQETFAPLITDSTVAFAHLDFHKVKLDTVEQKLIETAQIYLREMSFDKKSEETTMADLRDAVKQVDAVVRPVWGTITQTLAIQEVAVIVDTKLMELELNSNSPTVSPVVIVVPWKNKTAADLKKLLALFPEGENVSAFPAGDFLLFPIKTSYNENDGKALSEWFKGLKPAKDGKIQQALKAAGDAEFKFAAAISAEIFEGLAEDDMPKEVVNILAFAKRKIEWVAASVPLGPLLSGEKDNHLTFIIKTPKRSDAVQLRALLEQSIEFGINMMRYGIELEQKQRGEGGFQMPPVFFSFLKGVLRTFLPAVEDDTLVLKIKPDGWDKVSGSMSTAHGNVAVSGIAVAMVLPAIQAAREAARRVQCINNEKQIVLALHNYHDVFQGMPPLYTVDKDGKPLHSWRVLLLPFVEQQALYNKIRLSEPWDSEYNKQFHDVVVAVYQCPGNPKAVKKDGKYCCYSAIVGGGLIPANNDKEKICGTFARITDGVSNTLAFVEVKEPFCWMDPTADITLAELVKGINKGRCGSWHPSGANIAFFDGSVRFIFNDIDVDTLKAWATPDGGENVPGGVNMNR